LKELVVVTDYVKMNIINFLIMIADVNDSVIELEDKVIKEFNQLLISLEKGHRLNYELILEEIALINLINESKIEDAIFYLEFYLNNEFNTKWITF
jgi:hypothetical protein